MIGVHHRTWPRLLSSNTCAGVGGRGQGNEQRLARCELVGSSPEELILDAVTLQTGGPRSDCEEHGFIRGRQ